MPKVMGYGKKKKATKKAKPLTKPKKKRGSY